MHQARNITSIQQGTQYLKEIDIQDSVLSNDKYKEPFSRSVSEINKEPYETSLEHDSHIIRSLLNKVCKGIEQALDSGQDLKSISFENKSEIEIKERRHCSNWTLPKLNHCVARKFVDKIYLHV